MLTDEQLASRSPPVTKFVKRGLVKRHRSCWIMVGLFTEARSVAPDSETMRVFDATSNDDEEYHSLVESHSKGAMSQPRRVSTFDQPSWSLRRLQSFLGRFQIHFTVIFLIIIGPYLLWHSRGDEVAMTEPIPQVELPIPNETVITAPDIASQQIANYRAGTGLIINLHITHHAGTSVCGIIGHAPSTDGAPSGFCNHPRDEDHVNMTVYPNYDPWEYNKTAENIRIVRQYFHMIGWEHSHAPKLPLSTTHWEDKNLVSIFVAREPISRLLAGDGWVQQNFPGVAHGDGDEDEWWRYANWTHNTNNFALSILAGHGCCQGANTNRSHLQAAKALLKRFTFVLDLACLTEGLQEIANQLGIELEQRRLAELKRELNHSNHTHASNQERIPYPAVYEYLLERNRLDIELYEWTKTISLVRCDH